MWHSVYTLCTKLMRFVNLLRSAIWILILCLAIIEMRLFILQSWNIEISPAGLLDQLHTRATVRLIAASPIITSVNKVITASSWSWRSYPSLPCTRTQSTHCLPQSTHCLPQSTHCLPQSTHCLPQSNHFTVITASSWSSRSSSISASVSWSVSMPAAASAL